MSFDEIVAQTLALLEQQGRVSYRALKRRFELEDEVLADLKEELLFSFPQVKDEEDRGLVWTGAAPVAGSTFQVPSSPQPPVPQTSNPELRTSQSPLSYTPKHLADKILQSKSALEGERKQVTVLFADVKGSMELAEQLDPEAWHQILDRFFAILTDGVHRFEGTVNQYTGDGIMALFGAPIAHEDHAQRACYAALHLRERLRQYADELRVGPGVNFSFRLGLNSGEVIVGKIGDDLRMDYTAQGHTVGLAQRMEQLAPADGIALSQHTQKPVDGFFALRALGPAPVKGVREPVGVFVLEGVGRLRTRLDTARARGLSRFVGRDDEIEALESALHRALEGAGRVAAVVGEPGVGKSRMCAEFVERCRARGLVVYEAHCPAHGRAIPYLPLLELLRNLFGITEQDGPREARQKIAGELALLDDGFAADRDLVLDFLGVADPKTPTLQLEPVVRQRRLFTFLRRLIQRRTEAEPIVLLIDDLHWIDPGSDLFVAQIVEAVSATRTLLLVNFRPEYEADWTHKSWVLQLPLAPLGAEALAALVRDWVGSHPSVAALPALVGPRSGGNPFFAEEIVLSLLETGRLVGMRGAYELVTALDAVEVPATVQALLAARIDRLGEREKQVLYAAAVIGKEFPRPLLESVLFPPFTKGIMANATPASKADYLGVYPAGVGATGGWSASAEAGHGQQAARGAQIFPSSASAPLLKGEEELDAALAALLAAELVYERAIYPVAEYAFKHPLTHEVALHAQLTTARRTRHAAVAAAIAVAAADRLDEHAGLLAHHWTEAGEALRATTWHMRAARWVRTTDLTASRRHWAQARTLLGALPDSAERTRLFLEVYPQLIDTLDRLGAAPTESETVYLEAVVVARQAGDRRTEALIESAYGHLKTGQNEWPAVIEHAQNAVTLADAEGDRPVQLFARFVLGRAFIWQARLHESVRVFDQVAEIGGGDAAADIEVLGWRPYVEALSVRANAHVVLGRLREALEFLERLPSLLGRPGLRADLSSTVADRTWTCWLLGDADRARHFSSEALRMAERFGAARNVVYALLACGLASCLARRWDEGDGFFERARERIVTTGAGSEWSMFIDGLQALCWAEMGDHERGLALALRGVEQARANELDLPRLFQGTFRARVLRMVGGVQHQAELEAQIAETLELIQRTDAQGWLPFVLLERAGLARLRGDADGMARDLAEARRLFAQMGVTGWDDYARSIGA